MWHDDRSEEGVEEKSEEDLEVKTVGAWPGDLRSAVQRRRAASPATPPAEEQNAEGRFRELTAVRSTATAPTGKQEEMEAKRALAKRIATIF